MIRRFGYHPIAADGGQAALDILRGPQGKDISLLILDLVMPEVSGMDVLESLKTTNENLPVIVQTAQGSIDTVVQAMRAGADDFVVKPVSPERLKVSVQNALKVNAPGRRDHPAQEEGRRRTHLRPADPGQPRHGQCRPSRPAAPRSPTFRS